jgi:phosphogluconate dehydratase
VRDGDVIRLDAVQGTLDVLGHDAEWAQRSAAHITPAQAEDNAHGLGRDLFGGMRKNVTSAEEGAVTWL